MGRKSIITAWLLCLCGLLPVVAAPVTGRVAAEKAGELLRSRVADFRGHVERVDAVEYEGSNSYFVVRFVPEGWALIAADDRTTPLLGYSPTGHFTFGALPDNVAGWLEDYSRQIRHNAVVSSTAHEAWTEPARPVTRASDRISPIIRVNWNQGSPYNYYCPADNSGKRAVVGCVAVAMAQAMSVQQYPPRPQGTWQYTSDNYGSLYIDYDKEAAYNWSDIMSGANSKREVARLLWHCGVALSMDYGPDGSGTQSSYIPGALTRNFGYPGSVKYYSRTSYSGDWEQLILNELQAGRAVCYNGADPKKSYGHCFNLDGYDGAFFHVNWGWGGQNDGYFPLDGLRDNTMDMDYTSQQGVVVGIRAASDAPWDLTLSNTTVREKQPAGTVVGTVKVESNSSDATYSFAIRGEYSPILHGYVQAPFEVAEGELRTTAELDYADGDWVIDITATNTKSKSKISKTFTIHVLQAGEAVDSPAKGVSLGYVKATRTLTLSTTKAVTYLLYVVEGEDVVAEGHLEEGASEEIPLADVKGTMTLKLSNGPETREITLVPPTQSN